MDLGSIAIQLSLRQKLFRMRENGRGDYWCAGDQIADGQSLIHPAHMVSHSVTTATRPGRTMTNQEAL